MFNNNHNIKVGRDININIDKSNIESYNNDEILEIRNNAKKVLEKEFKRKLNVFLKQAIIFLVVFIGIYIFFPFYIKNNPDDFIVKMLNDEASFRLLCILGYLFTIITSINNFLFRDNEFQKSKRETIRKCDDIIREKKYLGK